MTTGRVSYSDRPYRLAAEAFVIRAVPETDWLTLEIAPRLESWMARDHPDQVRLRAAVDHAVEAISVESLAAPFALELVVGLPAGTPLLTGGRDLDNYAFPIVRRLGPARVVSVFASKEQGERSRIRAGVPLDLEAPDAQGWGFGAAEVGAPGGSALWRDQVAEHVGTFVAEPLPPGPVELHIAFRGRHRDWPQLWKATIDGLWPVLGPEPGKRYANDSRVTRLGLHHLPDAAADRTLIGAWWRPMAEDPSGCRS